MPFLDALISHKTIAVLDLSHNILGTYFPVTQVIFFCLYTVHHYFDSTVEIIFVLSLHHASLF
jgi:hypothetical protein